MLIFNVELMNYFPQCPDNKKQVFILTWPYEVHESCPRSVVVGIESHGSLCSFQSIISVSQLLPEGADENGHLC